MAVIPDTPAIAELLNPSDPVQGAARTRLLLLHSLGATDEVTTADLRATIADLESQRDARPTAEAHAELVAQVADLTAANADLEAEKAALMNPPGPFSVPIAQFRAGLIPMRKRLLQADPAVQQKWAVLLAELVGLSVVYPREAPVTGLIDEAVNDGVMLAAEAAALRGL